MLPVREDLSLCGRQTMCCFMLHIAYSMRLCFRSVLPRSHDPLHGCNVMRQPIPTIKAMWKRNLLTRAGFPYPHDDEMLLMLRKNNLLCLRLLRRRVFLLRGPLLLALNSVFPHLLLLLLLRSGGRRLCCLPQGNNLSETGGVLSGLGTLTNNRKSGTGLRALSR